MSLRRVARLFWCGVDESMKVLASACLKAFIAFALIMLVLTTGRAHSFSFSRTTVKGMTLFADGFESAKQPGADPCDSPLVMPEGFAPTYKSWAQCFTPRDGSPVPTYPNGLGFPVPLGANKGEYLVCEFVALPDQVTNLFFDPAQANPGQGYYVARPASSMFLGVSTCPGDFRMVQGCSLVANTGSLVTTTRDVPNPNACSLTAGVTYYLTVAPVDPQDGLTEGEHTCRDVPSSANGCDVQTRQTSN